MKLRPLVFVVALLLWPASAQAQAWLPFQGEGSLSLTLQRINLSGHFDTDGSRLKGCSPSRAYSEIFEFEYGVTNKLAINARLPYIASTFTGAEDEPCNADLHQLYGELKQRQPNTSLASLDTGDYYSTFQDFGFGLRCNVLNRGVVVTPAVGVTIPSHHYRTVGEAAPGQDRFAFSTGVNAGALLDPWAHGAYVHAHYAYSFVQHLYGVSLNRSNAELEGGYAVTPIVSLRGLVAWQHTHGGLTYAETLDGAFGTDTQPGVPELFLDHDRLLAARYWHIGGGATISLTDTIDLDAAVVTFPAGADSHYGVGMSVGVTWQVLTPRAPSRSSRTR